MINAVKNFSYFRIALISNMPFLLIPVLIIIKGALGLNAGEGGSDWTGLIFIIGMVFWLPLALLSILLLLLIKKSVRYLRYIMVVSVLVGVGAGIWLIPWLVFGVGER